MPFHCSRRTLTTLSVVVLSGVGLPAATDDLVSRLAGTWILVRADSSADPGIALEHAQIITVSSSGVAVVEAPDVPSSGDPKKGGRGTSYDYVLDGKDHVYVSPARGSVRTRAFLQGDRLVTEHVREGDGEPRADDRKPPKAGSDGGPDDYAIVREVRTLSADGLHMSVERTITSRLGQKKGMLQLRRAGRPPGPLP